jgi:hypothetical protein
MPHLQNAIGLSSISLRKRVRVANRFEQGPCDDNVVDVARSRVMLDVDIRETSRIQKYNVRFPTIDAADLHFSGCLIGRDNPELGNFI